ncbi:unnamed protein product, partial [Mesorhabditis belari]|uniref:Major facilitator superfamily (MFS) profile domain-containing protein n=1 Tax=Mesorhabditis belari TaxID=2138241 RepID=A0AAF3FRN5_9BILA
MFSVSLWNYSLSINPNVTESTFGLIVGANSFAQAIAAPIFGYWSNRIENVKLPLFIGLLFMVSGNILYSILPLFDTSAYSWLIVARLLTGIGAGNSALIRAYASQSSSSEDRSKAIAWTTAGDTLGTTTGPLIQLFFLPLGKEGLELFGFRINMYTSPALFACFIDLMGIVIVSRFFVEDYSMLRYEQKGLDSNMMHPCWTAVGVCVVTRYSQALLLSTFDGVGSSFASMMFGFTEEETVRNNNFSISVQAAIGLLVYFSFIYFNLGRRIAMRTSVLVALLCFILYHCLTFAYPFYDLHVKLASPDVKGRQFGVCESSRFTWCTSLTTYHPLVFYISYLTFVGGFFPIINIALTTLFSKVIGPRAQGTLQGLFQVAGCISKMSSPTILGSTYTVGGPRLVWILQITQLISVLFLWIIFRRKMIGMQERVDEQLEKECKDCEEKEDKTKLEILIWATGERCKA